MGEEGLAARSVSEIELTSILALGNADVCRCGRAVGVRVLISFCNARACDESGLFSLFRFMRV